MKKLLLIIIALCFVSAVYAQPQDRSPLSFSWLPNGSTVDVKKLSLLTLVGAFRLGRNDARLLLGAGYTYTHFDYRKSYPVPTAHLDNFHTISLRVGFREKINSKWSHLAFVIPQMSINFQGDLDNRDFQLAGMISFLKIDSAKGTYLTLGLAFNAQTGIPIPFPMISFRKVINRNWEYTVGILRSEVSYTIGVQSSVQSFLKVEGFTGNISSPVLVNNVFEDSKLTNRAVVGGFEYRYKLIRRISLSLEAGHALYNILAIRDHDNNTLYDFKIDRSVYLNVGFKLDL